jgi:Papain-like cysteine protease AvrRpt2
MHSPFICDRRRFFALLAGSVLAAPALADTSCQPTPQGNLCVSQVDFADFAEEAYQTQHATEWCWAACISMVFSFYGHPVSQERIVQEVYGGVVNLPAGYGVVIAQQLNRVWKDDNGDRFRSTLTGAYDTDAHVYALTDPMLIRELDEDHPIIIGAGGHAMVLTAIQYLQNQFGVSVQGAGVFDPWPGRGARALTRPELVRAELGGALRFVATARVEDVDN